MVLSCCAPSCRNKKNAGSPIKFYRFPLDPSRRMLWISAIRWQSFVPTDSHRLCSDHFISGTDSRRTKDALSHSWSLLGHTSLDPLHPDFVPSIFDDVDGRSKEKLKRKLKKYVQTTETKRKRSTSVACTAMEKDKTCTYASSAWIT